jgi:predicted enzyme related to lactoylglutathione lyase
MAGLYTRESTDRRQDGAMEALASRILLRPTEPRRSHRFYREILGLAIYRQFGSRDAPGVVFFLDNGLLEVSGRSTEPPGNAMAIWIQVRDVRSEHRRLLHAGVPILREPRQEAWGCWRCGSRIPTACELCWSRFQPTIRCDGTNGTSRRLMNEFSQTPAFACTVL